MFGLVDQILLRLLPVRTRASWSSSRSRAAASARTTATGSGPSRIRLFVAFRERNTVFSGLTGQMVTSASLIGTDRNEVVSVGLVAGNFFDVLGVRAQAGRLLTAEDDKVKGGHPVAVLQYELLAEPLRRKGPTSSDRRSA
jgi:hypothetical protein